MRGDDVEARSARSQAARLGEVEQGTGVVTVGDRETAALLEASREPIDRRGALLTDHAIRPDQPDDSGEQDRKRRGDRSDAPSTGSSGRPAAGRYEGILDGAEVVLGAL